MVFLIHHTLRGTLNAPRCEVKREKNSLSPENLQQEIYLQAFYRKIIFNLSISN